MSERIARTRKVAAENGDKDQVIGGAEVCRHERGHAAPGFDGLGDAVAGAHVMMREEMSPAGA